MVNKYKQFAFDTKNIAEGTLDEVHPSRAGYLFVTNVNINRSITYLHSGLVVIIDKGNLNICSVQDNCTEIRGIPYDVSFPLDLKGSRPKALRSICATIISSVRS